MALTSQTPNAPWLRTTPPDWLADRLKDIVPRILGGGTPPSSDPDCWEDGDIVWVTPTDFSRAENSSEISDSERKITRIGLNSSAATLLPQGTVIMASRATIGTVRLAGTELTTNQGFISFVCDERKLHRRFLYYVISGFLGEYFAEIAPGTTFQEISRGKAKLEPIGYPPPPEQQRIAAYLDASCGAIDAAVVAKRRQLETLDALRKTTIHRAVTQGLNPDVKMKSSGADWLSDVPAYWTPSRIKNVAKLSPGYSGRPPAKAEKCTFVPMELVSEAGTLDTTSLLVFEDVSGGLTLFEAGDVLFAKITPCMENGKGAFVENLPTRYAFGSTEFHVLRPADTIKGKFLYYYTYNPIFRAYAAENMSGAAGQKRVSSRFLKETRLFVPPILEQIEIVSFLTAKDREFRTLFAQIESQVATLIAYRKSLIHECVTGQRRISEADLNKVKAHG